MDELFALHDDGVFLRREAFEFGYDDRTLRAALRDGLIARVRHGAYVSAGLWEPATPERRHWFKSCAVLRSHTPGSIALSHVSSAVDCRLPLFAPDLDRVHVLCLEGGTGRRLGDVAYHCGGWVPEDIERVGDRLRTVPSRAAVETATLGTIEQGVVVLDGLLHQHPDSRERMHELVRQMLGWPDGRKLQVSARLAREGSESVGESRTRFLCWTQRLPEPELQVEVHDEWGHLVARLDFLWRDHGVFGEFDGRVKYGRLLREGEEPGDAVAREKAREDVVRSLTNWLCVRVIWSELYQPVRTGQHIRSKLEQGKRLHSRASGPSLTA